MNHKRKQKATAAMATLLSVSTMINPMGVMAQDDCIAPQDVTQKDEGQPIEKETIGLPELPKNLKAKAGTLLKEVKLPEHFTWVDGNTILSSDTKEYAARYAVDDTVYDYTSIKGYHADGHYIEFELSIDVEDELTISAPIIKSLFTSNSSIPSTYNTTGDIPIDVAHFPDEVFREYLKDTFDKDNDDTLSEAEIANIQEINVYGYTKIEYLTGIELFPNLKSLNCERTSISTLNVSQNTNLTYLFCNNTTITSLDVSNNKKLTLLKCFKNEQLKTLNVEGASALKNLYCDSNPSLQTLNVSNASALQTLDCYSTGIGSLDVSNNANLTSLSCYNNSSLKTLNVTGASALQTLDCHNTSIGSLDVSNNANLTSLSCYGDSNLQTLNVNSASALQTLKCYNTGISSLDVSSNTNLQTLNCYSTGIGSLDVSKNTNLTSLSCHNNSNLQTLTVAGASALEILNCYSTGISSLDVSKNANLTSLSCQNNSNLQTLTVAGASALKTLDCSSTTIASLDVSQNANLTSLSCFSNSNLQTLTVAGSSALQTLDCFRSGIISLDVSKNTKLTSLKCYGNNSMQSLNVTGASALQVLSCYNSNISSLDVSTNTNLTNLDCLYNPLSYLKIGNNVGLTTLNMSSSVIKLEVTEDTFNITEKFSGIDKDKVSIKSGATYDSASGIVSKYTAGTPIVYEYDCGTANGTNKTLNVTLTLTGLKKESTINITGNLDKDYDGEDIQPKVDKKGSTMPVTYTWEKKKNETEWETIASSPKDVGTYRVTAKVEADDNYKAAESSPVVFTISQADNNWTKALNIDDWIYGKTASTPSAEPKFGIVTYTYSDSETGTFKSDAPTNAGTWYVKASVIETDNFKGLEEIKQFEIKKAIPTLTLPSNLKGKQDALLSTVTLPNGWSWVKGDTSLTVNNSGYKARLTVDDANYDYTEVDGYNATGHYVEKTLTVNVAQGENTWTLAPSIENWIYGETASIPKGTAAHGTVVFTYSDSKIGTFKSDVPTSAGTWYMKATVAESDEYAELSKIVEFKISQADNSWTKTLAIDDWTYGKTASTPSAEPKFGTVTYTYSDSETGTFKSDVPSNAGTWYVKASVIKTDNYKGLEEIKQFEIKKAIPTVTLPSNLKGKQDALLSTVTLPNGWSWDKGDTSLTVNNSGYKARLTVDDANYDYTGVDGYNATGHYVEKTLTVSVAQGENTWTLAPSIENWSYGETANTPKGTATHGTVNFTYSDSKTGIFKSDVPSSAGTWYMKATVAESDEYAELSKIVEFKISQADNSWTKTLTMNDWTYGKTASTPSAEPKFGIVTYTYSDSETGTFKSDVPTNVGTWYVKASVIETDNFKGLEEIKQFEIKKATAPAITLPSGLNGKHDALLSTVTLPKDWSWVKGDTSLTINNSGYKARLAVDDANYDYTGVDGYNAKEHYVERTLTVSVAQADNSWTKTLTINDWTYGKTASIPTATAKYGTVTYTYSDSKTGTFKSDVPTNAGTWYVKASVIETDNFKGLEEIKQFEIKKAIPTLTLPSNLKGKQDALLSTVILPKGWIWVKDDTSLTVNNSGYKARLTVDDANYDYTEVDGYNATGHYVEKTLTISVAQGENTWTTTPSIENWIYGETASAPKGTAAHGTVNFTYSDSKTGILKSDVPSSAGTWYMKATVAESDEYAELSKIVEFKITQADNSWTTTLTIDDWTYGKTASTPSATAKYGTVTYTYSDSKTGTFKSDVPTNAGTWYVKANVTETDNFKGLEEIKQFEIKKAIPTLTFPSNLKGKQDALLSTVILPKGWTWVKDDTSLTVNNSGYKARLTVDDANYDYTGVDGYNAAGHYVEKTLTVSVAQGENTWTLAPSIENWIYGEIVSAPKGTATHGTVNFTYSDSKTGTFKSDVPTSAGTWYMKATVAESDEYAELSKIVEFKITQADNSWTKTLAIDDWTYGKTASTPSAEPKFGTVTYTYSDSETGTFKSDAPTNAGTWYVKASVIETDNYKGLEEVKQFEIKKAIPTLTLPSSLKGKQDALLSTVTLPNGWTWVKDDTSLTVNNSGYKARLTVDDANYDYTSITGYNADGHYVERTLTVSVAQGENTWTLSPSIENWIYGETASTPKGTAAHGTVNFTYSDSKIGTFKSDVPTSAGTWYMKATVAESDEYAELSKIVEFKISQADNSWTKTLTIDDWTYGKTASIPSVEPKFGTVTYTYSDSKTGTFKSVVPTNVGTWYVKASVTETENYKGMEEIIAFSIKPKNVETDTEMFIPNISSDTNLSQLTLKDGNTILLQGVDYDVYKEQNVHQGKVTIRFKGNYSGTIVKSYTINIDNDPTNTQTGDTSSVGLWTTLMVFAGGVLALLKGKKKKEEEH